MPSVNKIRIIIYLAGILTILFFIYLNVFRKVEEVFIFNVENKTQSNFMLPETQDFNHAELKMVFKKELSNPEDIRISSKKTLVVLVENRQKMIMKTEELRELLFRDNQTNYPNGSLLKYGKNLYFLERGRLRKIEKSSDFMEMGFSFDFAADIDKNVFEKMEKGAPLYSVAEFKKNPPDGLLVKSGENLHMTNARKPFPIFSEKILETVWENFFFLEVEDQTSAPDSARCLLSAEKIILCNTTINGYGSGKLSNAYEFEISGIPQDSISSLEVTLAKKPDIKSVKKDLKRLIF